VRGTRSWRRKRVLIPLTIVAVLVLLVALVLAELLFVVGGRGGVSMAPTMPACNGRGLAEGFTYRFRDPQRGELVVFHVAGELGGTLFPDPNASLSLSKRAIGIPGDTVVGRGGRVHVNGREADQIRTPPFPRVRLGPDEYFVLGDNRTFSQDSRDFGPVPRDAIFARVVLVTWPPRRIGVPVYDKARVPPGDVPCSSP
jgi:signal peptidase I